MYIYFLTFHPRNLQSFNRNIRECFNVHLFHQVLRKSGALVLAENDYSAASGQPRLLFYCASNVGLGHLGRTLRVIAGLRSRLPEASFMLATDARDSVLATQAANLACLRLPSFAFTDETSFSEKPFALSLSKRQLHIIRRNLLLTLVHSYQPNLVYMDTLPHGKQDEMREALRWLKRRHPGSRVVLCMRDIPAAPDETFKFTQSALVEKALAPYDRILIAGDSAFFDPGKEYGWPKAVQEKSRHIGFVVPRQVNPEKPHGGIQRILAAFGGGWEATALGKAVIEAVAAAQHQATSPLHLDLVTGPNLSPNELATLEKSKPESLSVSIQTYASDFAGLLARADVAILQAGSTVFQVLESDTPLILYYRDFKDREQEVRARLLQKFDGISVLGKPDLSADALTVELVKALSSKRTPRKTGFSFDGVENAVAEVLRLLPGPH